MIESRMTQLRLAKTSRPFLPLGLSFFKSTHLPLRCNVGALACVTWHVFNTSPRNFDFFLGQGTKKTIYSEKIEMLKKDVIRSWLGRENFDRQLSFHLRLSPVLDKWQLCERGGSRIGSQSREIFAHFQFNGFDMLSLGAPLVSDVAADTRKRNLNALWYVNYHSHQLRAR